MDDPILTVVCGECGDVIHGGDSVWVIFANCIPCVKKVAEEAGHKVIELSDGRIQIEHKKEEEKECDDS